MDKKHNKPAEAATLWRSLVYTSEATALAQMA
jgi:hypothetical protein